MKVIRSILAVSAGFVIFFGLIRALTAWTGNGPDTSGAYTNAPVMNYLILTLTGTVVSALVAGYITALFAASHEFSHAGALGLAMLFGAWFSMRQQNIQLPGWHQTTIAGCGPVAAMIGAAIRMLTKRRSKSR